MDGARAEVAAGRGVGAALVVGAAALWATLGLFARGLYAHGITPMEVASVRASIGLLGVALCFAPRPRALRIPGGRIPFFLLYGLVGSALLEVFYFETIERAPVAVAAALLYTAPVFVAGIQWLAGIERPDTRRALALVTVCAGVALATGAVAALLAGGRPIALPAVLFGLASGLTYALYTVFGKYALADQGPLTTLFWTLCFSAIALAFAAPPWRPFLRSPGALPLLLGIGILPTIAAYLLYLTGLRRLPASTASVLATAEPVFVAILGAAVLGETLGTGQIAGIAMVIAGGVYIARPSPHA